ncbi:DNA polymerase [Pyruvatibacter mobilis]|uniref:DNA polymerase I n=1 Tax=Pyruvatibacter mobilis TaxID=1712261 RepID=A0A845Q888_9HYPH|nr:DNA polymerase [Pyruvatibacter mobilis]NBG94488.1 DNA polymerase [Pyruvatibacter mobilis]QJD74008.1 DNA polymerase [Pyruvatibacter mobilis]GGD03328.1 DNA polymerase I [Pyruvatibacter mobilis]
MSRYFFDCETNGFLDELDRIHSLVLKDADTGHVISCADQPHYIKNGFGIEDGVKLLARADEIIGHNIIKFDIPALAKVYPGFSPQGKVTDTMVWARLVYPRDDLRTKDASLNRKRERKGLPRIDGKEMGGQKLETWGFRLGILKGTYAQDNEDAWSSWNPEMQDYCEQDVEVTEALYRRLTERSGKILADGKPAFPLEAIDLEHRVAAIVARQERYGFCFDTEKAEALLARLLTRRAELGDELQKAFPPRWRPKGKGPFVPKRDNARMGYVAGCPLTKVELTPFNPGSRIHVSEWLKVMRGWRPIEFTNDGHPKVDETILNQLPFPEAKVLAETFMIDKRLGQLSEGDQAWLKCVGLDGRIHGSVNTNGAVTGRMTHMLPNVGQVPSGKAPYGHECRECFTVPPDKVQVGCDADALELRCLAGYMAKYDNGSYIEVVLKGKKEDGTDNHSVNCRALGLDPKKIIPIDGKQETGRDIAKTWFYAFIYGAGDWKLGATVGVRGDEAEIIKAGKKSRATFLKNLPALGKLTEKVKAKAKKQGFIRGLDGRRLSIRSQHAALNTLLQSAGAIIMKKGLVILDGLLQDAGLVPGEDYEFVANVHDEWQMEVSPQHAEMVGQTARRAIQLAGEAFNFRCPLDGAYDIGRNWAETH